MTDIIQIFEEIQMVSINIQDNADFRKKVQETVGIFTGFCDKNAVGTHTDITVDCRKNTTYGNGRIGISSQQNVGNHGGCSRFSVRAGYGNRKLIIGHKLPKKLCTCQHRNTSSDCFGVFWIVRVNGCGVYNQIDTVFYIRSALSVENLCPGCSKPFGQIRFAAVRSGYRESAIQKDGSKTAHTNAADSDKMNMNR